VLSLIFASECVVWTSWRFAEDEKIPNLRHTNGVIGAYVTAGARIYLYRNLDRLQDRAIYCDTGSVIYIQNESEPPLIECGDKLGDMTHELHPGEYTQEFASGGPKNYT
jgi:hypothetical protein